MVQMERWKLFTLLLVFLRFGFCAAERIASDDAVTTASDLLFLGRFGFESSKSAEATIDVSLDATGNHADEQLKLVCSWQF